MNDGRKRVIIENVAPQIDNGAFSIKRIIGEKVIVEADIFADGHDALSARILYKKEAERKWRESKMEHIENDRWRGEFVVEDIGIYLYTIEGAVDYFKTWQRDFEKKYNAGKDEKADLLAGIGFIEWASKNAKGASKKDLNEFAEALKGEKEREKIISIVLDERLSRLMEMHGERGGVLLYEKELSVVVDRVKALFSAWYERFPRSCSNDPGSHGTFKDCEAILPEIARMGFDVFYLPPIHPIGKSSRKGKNNLPKAEADDLGSPWAIGSDEGGHKAIHPALGTMDDFKSLIDEAKEYGIEIALDLAFQCSPDHPYVKEHPEWFKKRPDGTIQYAENPPKKYEDIFPLNFESEDWKGLWEELKDVVLFWIDKGVRIFRVDNPHTKAFLFWEWLIKEIKRDYPDALFLSEAFTRPKVMLYLAKLGFTQSYTYFTWRNTRTEFIEYLSELTITNVREYFRPNFWPNTPDILPEHLQYGGRAAFIMRLVLAATLSSNYGIFGPSFELCISEALTGKEEYLNSEKYEIKTWDWDRHGNLKDIIARVNKIRKENPALQTTWNLKFYEIDNDYLMSYCKSTEDMSNIILMIVNLDPYHTQSGWVNIPLHELGIPHDQPYLVHDLLGDGKFIWHGEKNYVELNPNISPAHIFRVRKRLKKETDFDYFM